MQESNFEGEGEQVSESSLSEPPDQMLSNLWTQNRLSAPAGWRCPHSARVDRKPPTEGTQNCTVGTSRAAGTFHPHVLSYLIRKFSKEMQIWMLPYFANIKEQNISMREG